MKTLLPLILVLRVLAAALVLALVVLSWLPKDIEEHLRPGWAGQIDHVIAYAGAALVARLAFRSRPWWPLWAGFAVLAIVLEVGQLLVPGRTAQVIDAAASIAGAGFGILFGSLIPRRVGPPLPAGWKP